MGWTCTEGSIFATHDDGRIVELVARWDPLADSYTVCNAVLVDAKLVPTGERGPDLVVDAHGVRDLSDPRPLDQDRLEPVVDAAGEIPDGYRLVSVAVLADLEARLAKLEGR